MNFSYYPNVSQKENITHGSSNFPCAQYLFSCSTTPEGIVLWHWHDELEIVLITEGTLEFRIPGETILLHSGELIVINRKIPHYLAGSPKGTLKSFVFLPQLITGNFDSIFSEKYLLPLINYANFNYAILNADVKCISSFHTAFTAFSDSAFAYEFTVREKLSHIILTVYQKFESQILNSFQEHSVDNERIKQMLDFIHTHYQDNLTLAQISHAGHIGKRECLRCFKRTIAETPIQYLLKYRLMQSAYMLIMHPNTDIVEIALACGFDSPSYFSKQFKRFYQCTPKEYKNITIISKKSQ